MDKRFDADRSRWTDRLCTSRSQFEQFDLGSMHLQQRSRYGLTMALGCWHSRSLLGLIADQALTQNSSDTQRRDDDDRGRPGDRLGD